MFQIQCSFPLQTNHKKTNLTDSNKLQNDVEHVWNQSEQNRVKVI